MKKNGFTLIELLAVIIILGILMIIAIPSVTKYINDSRKSSYISTAKEIIAGARNLVNDGKLEMFDTDMTYYIDVYCIKTENGEATSPYGSFTKAYVAVTYDGKGYEYFWTSVDDAGEGIKNLIKYDNLDADQIESDLQDTDISTLRGIDGRSRTTVVSKANNCQKEGSNPATSQVSGNTGEASTYPINAVSKINNDTNLVDFVGVKIYTSNDVNNYVQFNGETWRIIGVHNGSIKIIRQDGLSSLMKYNLSSDKWEGSNIQIYLNDTYYNSLSSEAKNMIDNGTWNVGATNSNIPAAESYEQAQALQWTGKVGLVASYEYLYSANSICYSYGGGSYNSHPHCGRRFFRRQQKAARRASSAGGHFPRR